MKEFFNRVKESEVYGMLKDQSAMIIFVATVLGSFMTLTTKINTYLYDLGRFTKYNIPIDLISTEAFSFYDIVKTFASILCYVGGILTIYCIRMMFKSGLTVAKLKYELYGGKWERVKNSIRTLSICMILGVVLLSVDSLTILISSPASKTVAFAGGAFLVIFQWIYSGKLVKETNKKIEKSTVKDVKKEERVSLVKKAEEFTEEEVLKLANESIRVDKTMNYLLVVLPIVLILFFASIMGISNFTSGQNSTDNANSAYQIATLEEREYVVLDRTGDNYILARRQESEEHNILVIDTSEQRLVSVNGMKYKLEKFDKVILEGSK